LIAVTNSQILPLSITAYGYGIKMAAMQDSITHKHILKVIYLAKGKRKFALAGNGAKSSSIFCLYPRQG